MSDILKIRPSIKGAARAAGFIQAFCLHHAIEEKVAYKFCLAADEILPNIIALCTSPRIVLSLEKETRQVRFTIRHGGDRYDLSDKDNLVWPERLQQHQITELGLDIIHKYMDNIECVYADGENIIILTQYLQH